MPDPIIRNDVFNSRASLDTLFRPFDPKDRTIVDIMVVGTKEGNIHLRIYDSFSLGTFERPITMNGKPLLLRHHTSHVTTLTHSLFLSSDDEPSSVYYSPMDLRFGRKPQGDLSLLASRSTALQYLLRYIEETQSLMFSEWKSAQELPRRFISNVNETLAENDSHDLVQALYHSVATGHTIPTVKNWLVDELTERVSE